MSAYVPITVEVRDKYMEWWIDGEYVGQDAGMGEEFDAWLQSVKAEAWDEGFDACANWWEVHHYGVVRDERNPYRSSEGVDRE